MSAFLTLMTLACVLGISIGQLLFKHAAGSIDAGGGWMAWVVNPWLIAAAVLYGATTLLWVWVLRHAPLSVAYPFMGLAFLVVPVLAWALLGEPLTWQSLAGGALITGGVALASFGGQL